MIRTRITILLLVIVWLSTTLFQPLHSVQASLAAAPAGFSKASPESEATNQPAPRITLRWNPSNTPNVTYQYCVFTKAKCQNENKWKSVGASTSVTLTNLNYSTVYYWQVRAVDSGGEITYANNGAWWRFQTQPSAPGAIGKITPTDGTSGVPSGPGSSLALAWTASSTPGISYEYCLDTSDNNACDQPWTSVGNNLTVNVTDLIPGATYFWQVRGVSPNSVTYANNGAWWTFQTTYALPLGFNKTAPGNTTVNIPINPTLTWSVSEGENVSYQYCIDTSNDNACSSGWQQAGTNRFAVLSGLNYNTPYYWQVRAVNSAGTVYAGGQDAWWRFTTQVAPPQPFTKTAPGNGQDLVPFNVYLTWNPSAGTDVSYEVCIDTSVNEPCSTGWRSTSATTLPATNLNPDTTYYWQVRASNSNNSGPVGANNGAWWSFKTLPAAPTSFVKLSPQAGAANQQRDLYLYWSESENADTYEYCLETAAQNSSADCDTQWTSADQELSVLASSLLPNTDYFWQVRAVNATETVTATDGWRKFTTLPAPPVINAGSLSYTIAEDTLLENGQIQTTGAPPQSLAFALSGRAPAGTLNLQPNGSFTYLPVQDYHGPVTFEISVSDGLNPPQVVEVLITVPPVNDAPRILPIPNKVVKSGQRLLFTVMAFDPDLPEGDLLTLDLLDPLDEMIFTAETGGFYWMPQWYPGQPQVYTLTFTATDTYQPPATGQLTVEVRVAPHQAMIPLVVR